LSVYSSYIVLTFYAKKNAFFEGCKGISPLSKPIKLHIATMDCVFSQNCIILITVLISNYFFTWGSEE